jgi:hypothetical protein
MRDMSTDSRYRNRSVLSRLIGIVLVIWFIIGAIAAGQRGYYTDRKATCASVTTIVVTILAGPLNYAGVNPKEHCPHPSR